MTKKTEGRKKVERERGRPLKKILSFPNLGYMVPKGFMDKIRKVYRLGW